MADIDLNKNPLISVKQAAELLQVSIITIKRWLKSGKLHGSKIGGTRWRVFLGSCKELVERGQN
jgi:excisionase family DNA binding protein